MDNSKMARLTLSLGIIPQITRQSERLSEPRKFLFK
eukprot:COSAG02_NODE_1297_length_13389_cov_6.460572_12_plen_35_part_01